MGTIACFPTEAQDHGVDPGQVITMARQIRRMMPYLLPEDAERIAVARLIFGVGELDVRVFVDEARR